MKSSTISRNDAAHMRRFMQNLKNRGFMAQTVVSDRSPLYPGTIDTVWPAADHQFCVFHVMAEINKLILGASRDVRKQLKPKQIKKGRGRPSRRQQALVRKKKEKLKQAENLFRNRHDLVRKRSKMSKTQKQRLDLLTSLSPTLVTLRKFTDDLHALFSLRPSPSKAWQIWRRMRRTAKYRQIPALAKALEVLCKPNMNKLLVYLKQSLHQRTKIRTNNHVESSNRKLRYLEKVRYK